MWSKLAGTMILLATGPCWAAMSASPDRMETGGYAACSEAASTTPGSSDYCDARTLWLQGDFASAERKLRRAASLNNAAAQYLLGVAYFNGDGVDQDRSYGLAWLAMATHSNRQDHLGTFRSAYGKASHAERSRGQRILDRLQRQVASRTGASIEARSRAFGIASSERMGWPDPTMGRSERMGPAPSNVVSYGSRR